MRSYANGKNWMADVDAVKRDEGNGLRFYFACDIQPGQNPDTHPGAD